jgi:quinoprotein dehydrogenase-associated probable ABC transporter substrate-binding protein
LHWRLERFPATWTRFAVETAAQHDKSRVHAWGNGPKAVVSGETVFRSCLSHVRRKGRPCCAAEGLSRRRSLANAILGLAVLAWSGAQAQEIPDVVTPDVLRVCADPANMPFSNRQEQGFENRIAAIVADELKIPLRYYWMPQGPGFVRNTLNAGLCDVIMGHATGAEPVQHTNPYYRSIYVLIVKRGGALDGVDRLSDPRLKRRRLGVIAATPPTDQLVEEGLIADAKPYALVVDRRYASPAEEMIADLIAGVIDGALLWGPIGGYFARRAEQPLIVVPLLKDGDRPPLSYRIAFGIRHNEQDWKRRLNQVIRRRQADFNTVLLSYGVPLLDDDGRLIGPDATPSGAAP